MTLVKNFEADKKLAHKPAEIIFFLVFGGDAGLIAERARRIVRLSVDDASDPGVHE